MEYRRHRNYKHQQRLARHLSWRPKEGVHNVTIDDNLVIKEGVIPAKIPESLKSVMEVPEHKYRYTEQDQCFYFFLSHMPPAAIKILSDADIVRDNSASTKEPAVYYDSCGYSAGSHYLNWSVGDGLKDGQPLVFDRSLTERLVESCEGDVEALKVMKRFGFYTTDSYTYTDGSSAMETMLDLDASMIGPEEVRFYNDMTQAWAKQVTFRSKKDMRSTGKHRTRTNKGPYKGRKKGGVQGEAKKLSVEVTEDGRTIKKQHKSKEHIPEHHRFISTDPRTLYRACVYIATGRAKAGHFRSHNSAIKEPLDKILGYLQSRVDRSLYFDIDEFITRENPVVDYRLKRWEEETGKGIQSVRQLLKGEFYDYAASKKSKEAGDISIVVDSSDKVVYVSQGVLDAPELYVINEQQLETAARRVLRGKMDVSDFRVLDPRTNIILTYCEELREASDGDVSRADMNAVLRLQDSDLRARLERNNLIDQPYQFVFGNTQQGLNGRTYRPHVVGPQDQGAVPITTMVNTLSYEPQLVFDVVVPIRTPVLPTPFKVLKAFLS